MHPAPFALCGEAMAHPRPQRVAEQIKRELAELLRHEVRDPRAQDATITAVRVSQDLQHARVFVTSLRDDTERSAMLSGLDAAAPFLRGELGRRLRLRRAPELRFEWDESLAHGLYIERLLEQVLPPDEPDGDDSE